MKTKRTIYYKHEQLLIALGTLAAFAGNSCLPAIAASSQPSPTGTLLVPLSPKLDTSLEDASTKTSKQSQTDDAKRPATNKSATSKAAANKATATKSATNKSLSSISNFIKKTTKTVSQKAPIAASVPNHQNQIASNIASSDNSQNQANISPALLAPDSKPNDVLKTLPDEISPELGDNNDSANAASVVGEDTTLKGTIQIVADDTEYDQEKNTFLGTGNAVALIHGENSKLEADTILYDQNTQLMDARGNVRIIRDGQLTTGSSFKFKVTSDEYLITNPDTEVQGTQVIARKGYGNKQGLAFKDGTLDLPEPIHYSNNAMWAPLSVAEEIMDKQMHPDAFVPSKPSFKFKARKMTYERYKDAGNLTVFGGRAMVGSFGVPVPKFTLTVGKENTGVTFPITPLIGNVLWMGGISLGPSFNYAIGKQGVFSAAPLVQFGGKRADATGTTTSGSRIGTGGKISYVGQKFSTHWAYGSVSDLLVGDINYKFNKTLKFQLGVNRFLEDGMFGARRARFLAEAVHNKSVGGIPFLAGVSFRTSAGMAQDDSSLLNLTPDYAKLFDKPVVPDKKTAFRLEEQITVMSQPIFAVGDNKVGMKFSAFGGAAVRAYSTGDGMIIGQVGPQLDLKLNRVNLRTNYVQSAVRGKSPFVFDQYIQGTKSLQVGGDIRLHKYLTVGAQTGYNLQVKDFYSRSIQAAIGPEDFKFVITRDTLRGLNRIGFDMIYGSPIKFDRLIMKGSPDHGQLGGM